jgi:hypothetical protein
VIEVFWPKVMIGTEAAIVTAGGGPVTTIFPVRAGWRASWYR